MGTFSQPCPPTAQWPLESAPRITQLSVPGCGYRPASLAARLGCGGRETVTLSSSPACDHQSGLAVFSRNLVHTIPNPVTGGHPIHLLCAGDPSSWFSLVVFLLFPSVPLKIHTNAYQSKNSELGVSAAGFNLANVSGTHPPKLYRAPSPFSVNPVKRS